MKRPVIFLETYTLGIGIANAMLFLTYKTLPEHFFWNVVQTSGHVLLSVFYCVQIMSLKVVLDFWEQKEFAMGF